METNNSFDDQRWVLLRTDYYIERVLGFASKELPDYSLEERVGEALGFEYHLEPLTRFNNNPPGNHHWKLYKIYDSPDDAWAAHTTLFEEDFRLCLGLAKNQIGINGSEDSLTTRMKILTRDGFRCRICGRSAEDGVKLEVDHIHPKSKGGDNTAGNLWTLCFDCNRGKRDEVIPELVEYSKSNT